MTTQRKVKLTPEELALFQKVGRLGGLTTAARLTPEQRSASAKRASAARETQRQERRRAEAAA